MDWGYFNAGPGPLEGLPITEVLGYYRDFNFLEPTPEQLDLEKSAQARIPVSLENTILWEHCLFLWKALRKLDMA